MRPTYAEPISWAQLQAMPLPPPGLAVPYGPGPQQTAELRLPEGTAPGPGWPVAVLIHGGCWLNQFNHQYFAHLSQALAAQGIASYTPEYRRIGDTGGGWPNTFLDVGLATDQLRSLIKTQPLNLKKVVVVGHSAGGQLALWLASRAKLPTTSPLYAPHPLKIRAVVGMAAITDLVSYRVGEPGSCNSAVDELLGGPPALVPERYAQTSPWALLPLGVPQWLLQGSLDPIVPALATREYASAAQQKGDTVKLVELAEAGHFDLAAPSTGAGAAVVNAVLMALGR